MQDFRDQLSDFLGQEDHSQKINSARLCRAWEEVASENILLHTINIIFDKKNPKIAVVFTDNSVVKADLTADQEIYRNLLSQALGYDTDAALEAVRFALNRRSSLLGVFRKKEKEKSRGAKGSPDRVEPLPLSPEEERHARETVECIKDERLKESLYNAMKSQIEWKKGIEAAKKP